MNKRFLLYSLNRRSEDNRSDSSSTSLFNVIKKNTNALLLKDLPSNSKNGESNYVLKSVINSGKEGLNPLTRLLYKNDKLELLRSFNQHFNDKFGTNELMGYISRKNSSFLSENLDYFKQILPSDIHIFTSEHVRFSSNVVVLQGVIGDSNYEFLLHKKRLKWFLRNFQVTESSKISSSKPTESTSQPSASTSSHPYELSQKIFSLINSKESGTFAPETMSLVLFDPMFLSNHIVIAKVFMLIY